MKNETNTSSAPGTSVAAKQLGRPSNPNSKRQVTLSARAAAKAAGTFKKGRPSVAAVRHLPFLGENNVTYDRKTPTEVTARNIKNVNGAMSSVKGKSICTCRQVEKSVRQDVRLVEKVIVYLVK